MQDKTNRHNHTDPDDLIEGQMPVHRTCIGRDWEIQRIKSFLDQTIATDSQNYPPIIMVVHGPANIGKTILVREVVERYCNDRNCNFRTIRWFSEDDLILGQPDDLPANNKRPSKETLSELLSNIENENDPSILNSIFGIHTQEQLDSAPDKEFSAHLPTIKPFLLIIDGFDTQTNSEEYICSLLEKIRPPNKVILTSRSEIHAFKEQGAVYRCPVGLLNKDGTASLVVHDLDRDGSLLHRCVNENMRETAEWVWEVSNGLPHFITMHLFPEVKRSEKKFGPNSQWAKSFSKYASIHLNSQEHMNTIFSQLTDEEKYILVMFALQTGIQSLTPKVMLDRLGVIEHGAEVNCFEEALRNLYKKHFICCRFEPTGSDTKAFGLSITWILPHFLKEPIRKYLAAYEKTQFYQERGKRLLVFFEYYLQQDDLTRLEPQFDQALSILSWCTEHEKWELALNMGQLLLKAMSQTNYHQDWSTKQNKFKEASKKTIQAAQATRNLQIEIDQRLHLVSLAVNLEIFQDEVLKLVQRYEYSNQASIKFNSDSQAKILYYYARLLLIQGKGNDAKDQFKEAITLYERLALWEDAGWALLDLAELNIYLKLPSEAANVAQKVKQINILLPNKKIALEQAVKANTILAYLSYLNDQLQESLQILEDTKNLVKQMANSPLKSELFKVEQFIRMSMGNFNPIVSVDEHLSHSFLLIEATCSICRESARNILFSDQVNACIPCEKYYHTHCLREQADGRCPTCLTSYTTT